MSTLTNTICRGDGDQISLQVIGSTGAILTSSINIGTSDTYAESVSIGNNIGGKLVFIDGGTEADLSSFGLNLGSSGAQSIMIGLQGDTAGANSTNIYGGGGGVIIDTLGQIYIGNSAAQIVNIGNNTSTHGVIIEAGSGGIKAPSFGYGALVANNTGLITSTAPSTAGFVLTSNGVSAIPTFQSAGGGSGITTISGNSGSITGSSVTISGDGTIISTSGSSTTLSITSTAIRTVNGGTGTATASSNAITVTGTGVISTTATSATVTIASTAANVINGGTGSATASSNTFTVTGTGPVSTSGTGSTITIATTAANTISATSGTATASSNTFTVVGAGTVSTSATGSTLTITGVPLPWVNQNSGSVTMVVNTGYVINNGASLVTLTLPATAAQGTTFQILGFSSGGWSIAQASGQNIRFGNVTTTTSSGTLSSTNQGDCVTLVCAVANTNFVVQTSVGNLTYV